jgi:hypothetical protein
MVMTAEMFGDGRRDVATTPPIEWPMIMMDVPLGYRESM